MRTCAFWFGLGSLNRTQELRETGHASGRHTKLVPTRAALPAKPNTQQQNARGCVSIGRWSRRLSWLNTHNSNTGRGYRSPKRWPASLPFAAKARVPRPTGQWVRLLAVYSSPGVVSPQDLREGAPTGAVCANQHVLWGRRRPLRRHTLPPPHGSHLTHTTCQAQRG